TWQQHQKNHPQHITNSIIQKLNTFNGHSNFDDENVIDYFNTQLDQSNFDDENEIYSDTQMNEFEDHNEGSINMAETSLYTEIIENSLQEYNESAPNKTLVYKPKRLSTLQLDHLSMDDQSDDNNKFNSSNQSKQGSDSNQSDENNNSDQDEYDIYEEIDINEETDNEDYERIKLSSLLNANSRLPDTFPELSYNP
ncbi:20286_t:CDS:2, partial [Racocetra persica]